MTIELEITGEKLHNLCAQYFGAACPCNRKLICSVFPKKHYVVLGKLFRFYFDRRMRLIKVHRAISFKSSSFFASYIANNTEQRKQFNHDDVNKAFYKLMNNPPYRETIENVAWRTDIRLLNYMEKRGGWQRNHTVWTITCSMARLRRLRNK